MSVALGTKVFSRENKLKNLLESVESHPIDRVIVADDGAPSERKTDVLSADWEFELTVLDMEYDAGLGAGRKAMVDELTEEYLFIMDTDHELPPHVMTLLDVLRADERRGGVAGSIFEPRRSRIYDGCRDFEESSDGRTLRFLSPEKEIHYVNDWAYIPYDFIPNAAVFRREAVVDYCWDAEYVIGWEHGDFYVGHWKETDWEFGLCPDVLIRHYPGGSDDYVNNRESDVKNERSYEYFLGKWGYDEVEYQGVGWVDTRTQTVSSGLREQLNRHGVVGLARRAVGAAVRTVRNG